jgi:predicted nucleic acid-binding protein
MPEYALEEVSRHAPMICKRANLSPEMFELLMALLIAQVELIPETALRPWLSKARRLLTDRNRGDIPFLAAVYAVPCDGLWSEDADFKVVQDVPIWTTTALLKHLGATS